MANEATIQSSLMISKSNLKYRSFPTNFRANVTGSKGPVPGAVLVSVIGTDIDFSELTTPGLVVIRNLSTQYFIEWGVYNGSTFFPVGEVLPGESYVFRFSRYLNQGYVGTGTGNDTFRIRASTAPCDVVVEAFEA